MRRPIRKKIKKVMNRSGTRICPICQEKQILVEHHINGRDIPNPNQWSNLADICDNCHRRVHEGIIVIEGWFTTTDGKELLWHYSKDQSFSGQDSKPHIIPKGFSGKSIE
jgi:hypothetical protein